MLSTPSTNEMNFQDNVINQHPSVIARKERLQAASRADEKKQPRSRRDVGTAPKRLPPSRVSRRGLPCPETHDTPPQAGFPFPPPDEATDEDFVGFITVDSTRQRKPRRRHTRRPSISAI
jgi:hypothetical protein